ncbi:hypothetical protein V6N11_041367 [Hibiscus sabdariffa]|uniref:Uncharacterized protein n=1 Tax=Hibiscus sabdariffa TaxID=183260 RepID=A0ABR2RKG3_9ROSI
MTHILPISNAVTRESEIEKGLKPELAAKARDAKALQENAAKKAAQAEGGGNNAGGGGATVVFVQFQIISDKKSPTELELEDAFFDLHVFINFGILSVDFPLVYLTPKLLTSSQELNSLQKSRAVSCTSGAEFLWGF